MKNPVQHRLIWNQPQITSISGPEIILTITDVENPNQMVQFSYLVILTKVYGPYNAHPSEKILLVVSYRVKWVEQNSFKIFQNCLSTLLRNVFRNFLFSKFWFFFSKISFQNWFQLWFDSKLTLTRVTFVVCFFPDLTQWFLNGRFQILSRKK